MAAPLLFAANAQVDMGRSEQSSFKLVAALVLVPVTVTNRRGALLNGLSKEPFDLQENKIRQKVSSFSEEDVPVSIGILFDASGSMKHSLDEARTVLRAFLNDANPRMRHFSTPSAASRAGKSALPPTSQLFSTEQCSKARTAAPP